MKFALLILKFFLIAICTMLSYPCTSNNWAHAYHARMYILHLLVALTQVASPLTPKATTNEATDYII